MKKITLLFLTTICCTVSLFAKKAPVIATVDIQRVLNDYNTFQVAVEKIKSSVEPVEEEMKKMQENLQAIVIKGRELEAEVENPSLDEGRKEEAQAEITELRKQLQAEKDHQETDSRKTHEPVQKDDRREILDSPAELPVQRVDLVSIAPDSARNEKIVEHPDQVENVVAPIRKVKPLVIHKDEQPFGRDPLRQHKESDPQ